VEGILSIKVFTLTVFALILKAYLVANLGPADIQDGHAISLPVLLRRKGNG